MSQTFIFAFSPLYILSHIVPQSSTIMESLISIRAVLLGTYILARSLDPATALRRSDNTTTTIIDRASITKTFVRTEVRKMATTFLWPHNNTSHVSSESSMINLQVTPAGLGDSYLGAHTSNLGLPNSAAANTITKRTDSLYHLKIDLASEGYISVYMPNSTASVFCKTGGDVGDGDKEGPYRLDLVVQDSKQTVGIPVHDEAAAKEFCTEFTKVEGLDEEKSPKPTKTATGNSAISKLKPGKSSSIEDDASASSVSSRKSFSLR
jgi:hypothetical protein